MIRYLKQLFCKHLWAPKPTAKSGVFWHAEGYLCKKCGKWRSQ